MQRSRSTYIGLAVIALLALAIVSLPGGGDARTLISGTLQAAFLAAIAWSITRLYYGRRDWLSQLEDRTRGVLYGAFALALVAIVSFGKYAPLSFAGVMLYLALVVGCAAAVYWVWTESRKYII
jgi:hypothetical protein